MYIAAGDARSFAFLRQLLPASLLRCAQMLRLAELPQRKAEQPAAAFHNSPAAGTGTALSQPVCLAQQNLVKAGGGINRNARKVEPLLNLLRARIPVALCFFAVTEPCFLAPAPSPALLRGGVAFAIFAVRYNV